MSFNFDCLHCGSSGGGCLECGKKFSYVELRRYKKGIQKQTARDILNILEKNSGERESYDCLGCSDASIKEIEQLIKIWEKE